MKLTMNVYSSREAARLRIEQEPTRSQRHMSALFSGAVNGWVIEWRRTRGGILALTSSGWANIWQRDAIVDYETVA